MNLFKKISWLKLAVMAIVELPQMKMSMKFHLQV